MFIKLRESKNGWIKLYYDKIGDEYMLADSINHKYQFFTSYMKAIKYFERITE